MTLQIKIKYSDDTQTRISKIEQGDWIDLRAAEDITIKKVNSNLSRLELRWNCRKDMRPMSFRVQVHISISVSFRQIQWESLMNHIKATMTSGFFLHSRFGIPTFPRGADLPIQNHEENA